MMATRSKSSGMLRVVEERYLKKKTEEAKKQTQISYIPEDCISNIIVRLPIESLQRSRLVCKTWYNIVKTPNFINAYLHRSETVLIFLSPKRLVSQKMKVGEKCLTPVAPILEGEANIVSVESKLSNSSIFAHPYSTKNFVQFLEIKGGKSEIVEYSLSCLGNIRATCNGLILLDNKLKKGAIIVMNPVTRKLIPVPAGTLSRFPDGESYGFVMNAYTGEYQVVHLFRDQFAGYVGCEIFSLSEKAWREISGPSFGLFGNGGFGYKPVTSFGALHWIPHYERSSYIVSMEVDKEKFHQIELPRNCKSYDRIMEIGGFLGFITREDKNHIDIWILKGLCGEVWTKNHSITVDSRVMVPLCSLRLKGDIIFKRNKDGCICAYDFQQQKMTEIGMMSGFLNSSTTYMPHVSSLVSWVQASDMVD